MESFDENKSDDASKASSQSQHYSTDGESLASNASDGWTDPDTYVLLSEEMCGHVYKLKDKTKVVCGRPVVQGRVHCRLTGHRTGEQEMAGFYFQQLPVKRGDAVILKADSKLTQMEYATIEQAAKEAQDDLYKEAAAKLKKQQGEVNTPIKDVSCGRVAFDMAANTAHSPVKTHKSPSGSTPSRAHRSIFDDDDDEEELPSVLPSAAFLTGHEHRDGRRAFSTTEEHFNRLDRNGFNAVRVFDTRQELQQWLMQAAASSKLPGGKAAVATSASAGGAGGGDSNSSGSDSDDSSFLPSTPSPNSKASSKKKKSSKNSKSKSSSRKSHRKSSRRGISKYRASSSESSGSDSDSSTSSSETSSSNSSNSTLSSSDKKAARRRRRRRKKGKKKKKKTSSTPRIVGLFSKDESTGDSKKAFGMEINGNDLQKALCPEGMSSKERQTLAGHMVDVTAMPGTYHKNSSEEASEYDKLSLIMDGMLAMHTAASGGAGIVSDKQWKQRSKLTLTTVKSLQDLVKVSTDTKTAESHIFEQQQSSISQFLRTCGFKTAEVQQFLCTGLFMRVVNDTNARYQKFLTLAMQSGVQDGYNGQLAQSMIEYHTKNLLQIRLFSPSYYQLLVQTYVYLRDAEEKKFADATMYQPLLQDILRRTNELTTAEPAPSPTPRADNNCTYCQSRGLHASLGVGINASHCPFKGKISQTKARSAAKKLLKKFNDETGVDKKAAVAAAIAENQPQPAA